MIKSYLLIAWRSLLQNKLFGVINILGLAIGLAAAILAIQHVSFEMEADEFHEKGDRIYGVGAIWKSAEGEFHRPNTNAILGPTLKEEYPEVETYTRVSILESILKQAIWTYQPSEDKVQSWRMNSTRVWIGDEYFFQVFSFNLLKGNPETVLKEPLSLALSESAAKKYFGKENPVGKVLTLNDEYAFTITGVFEDFPENSQFNFGDELRTDMMLSLSSYGVFAQQVLLTNWRWPQFQSFILLKEGARPEDLEAKLPDLYNKYVAHIHEEYQLTASYFLESFPKMRLSSKNSQRGNNYRDLLIYLTLAAFLILGVAWVNYLNLTTALSLKRSLEIGIRKVSGATQGQLIRQFMTESFLMNLFAMILGLALAFALLPLLNYFTGVKVPYSQWGNPEVWLYLGALLGLSTLLSGSYPAFVLSNSPITRVMKSGETGFSGKNRLRKVLVIAQFFVALVLISLALLASGQIRHLQKQPLGFQAEKIVVFKGPAKTTGQAFALKARRLEEEVRKFPGVAQCAGSSHVPSEWGQFGTLTQVNDRKVSSAYFVHIVANPAFPETFEFSLLAGRKLDAGAPGDSMAVLVTRELTKTMGFSTPEDALGSLVFTVNSGNIPYNVVGVIENFENISLERNRMLSAMVVLPNYEHPFTTLNRFSVRLQSTDIGKTLAGIKEIYEGLFPNNPVEYFFMDEFFGRNYLKAERTSELIELLAVLAIFVACMGLLGLATFNAQLRTKEIGIRKICGASLQHILVLLSKDYFKLILIASLFAIPISVYASMKWLENFAVKMPLNPWLFLIPVLLLMLIAALTVASLTWKAARTNPVRALRYE